jgi:hypothetical protein
MPWVNEDHLVVHTQHHDFSSLKRLGHILEILDDVRGVDEMSNRPAPDQLRSIDQSEKIGESDDRTRADENPSNSFELLFRLRRGPIPGGGPDPTTI